MQRAEEKAGNNPEYLLRRRSGVFTGDIAGGGCCARTGIFLALHLCVFLLPVLRRPRLGRFPTTSGKKTRDQNCQQGCRHNHVFALHHVVIILA